MYSDGFCDVVLLCVVFSDQCAEKPYEIRELTAYLYDMDHTATYDCLFSDALPDVPYMDAKDYLSIIYTVEFEERENADGTFTITSKNGTMTVDPVSDTVTFDLYETFALKDSNKSGSVLDTGLVRYESSQIEGTAEPLTLDLAEYHIDLIADNGRIYFPLATLVDLFIPTYNAAEYVGGNIYFLHTSDNLQKDGYFYKSPLYESFDRAQSLVDFTYHEPCFYMDHFYGETSGGGSCTRTKAYYENAHYYFISGEKKFIRSDNSDADIGAAVDYDLTKPSENGKDYSGLFDIRDVGEKVHDFYGDWKLGDANLDGEVDVVDATTIQRFDANMIPLSDTALKVSDVDRDGEVTILDATWIQRWELNMKAPAGIGEALK